MDYDDVYGDEGLTDSQRFDPDGYGDSDFDDIFNCSSEPPQKKREPSRKLSDEEVDRRLHEAYNGRLERISPYYTLQSPLRCRCKVCGQESYKRFAYHFLSLAVWPFCGCPKPPYRKRKKANKK